MQAVVLDAEWNPQPTYDLGEQEEATKRSENASVTWQHPQIRITERDKPEPSPHEALVRVEFVGICGSDLSMTASDEHGYMHYSAYAQLPTILGHEFAGEVVDIGDDVGLVEPGDLVTAEVTDYCMRCEMCRRGSPGHCNNFEQLGFTRPGAFAEYITVPETLLWDVESLWNAYQDRDRLLMAAATIEPSTITYHGLFARAEGIRPGDYYVFHGLGPIGLTGMNIARAAGAGKVIGFDVIEERLKIARNIGFEKVFDPTRVDPVTTILDETNGQGADVHLETADAVEQTYPVIEQTMAEGANVVHISNASSRATIDTRQYQGNAAQIYGAEGHTGNRIFPHVIRLMAAGRLDNTSIITSIYDLSQAVKALEKARQRVDGKVMISV